MTMRRVGLALAFLLIAASAMAAGPGRIKVRRNGTTLTITPPPEVLQRANVRKHLDSGLTTTLAIEVDIPGQDRRGTARVDVRYDLWDERWLVTTVDSEGREHESTQPSFDRLLAWWSALALPAVRIDGMVDTGLRVHVRMSILPFSERERSETEEWVSRTVGLARSGSESSQQPRGSPGVLDAAIITSIRRRAVERFEWDVDYHPARP